MHEKDSAPRALLIVDVQRGIEEEASPGERNNPGAEANMAALLHAFRSHGQPVIHIRHDSVEPASALRPELPGNAYKTEVQPLAGEVEFRKQVNNAFIGTGLEAHLRACGIAALVIVGLTTDHCVSATTRMASDLGFDVSLVADATATFARRDYAGDIHSAEQVHRVNLASLDGEFCRVCSTADLLQEFAR